MKLHNAPKTESLLECFNIENSNTASMPSQGWMGLGNGVGDVLRNEARIGN